MNGLSEMDSLSGPMFLEKLFVFWIEKLGKKVAAEKS